MSDNLYERFRFENNDDDAAVSSEKAADESAVTEVKPVEAQTHTNKGGEDFSFADAYQLPKAEKVQDAVETDSSRGDSPFVNPYQAQRIASADASPVKPTSDDYSDGFYHQTYQAHTSGNHVNYTRPAASVVNEPQQSVGSRYGSYAQPDAAQRQPYTTRISEPQPRRKKEKSGMSKGAIAILLVVCVLISGLAGFGGSMLAMNMNQPTYESTASDTMVIHKVDAEVQVAGTENLTDKSTSEITAEVADTVVEITTEVMQTSSYYGQYVAQGAGSGVIISDDGYILTNNHVIDGASSIKVTTRGGDTYDATLVGTDSKVDIALLKIEATGLPTAVFGDSSTLQVGSKAVIIGNPLGTLGGSVTEGIISALDRSIDIDGKTMHLMQTDAAINPGNSGGGMFNGQGELTGIVVAKSSSEEIDNIGFVIPINNVLDILGDLKDYGYVRGRADTGMEYIDLSNQMYAWYYYGNNETGVYISSVDSGSNADSAGFRKGDRVVSIDGTEITSSTEVETAISDKSAGDTVTFVISRNGNQMTLELTLDEEIPESVQGSNNSSDYDSDYGNSNPYGGNPFGGFFGR